MNRYVLTDPIKNKYLHIIKKYIKDIEKGLKYTLDLSDSDINPYTLGKVLELLHYQKVDIDTNGWEMDFDISYEKEGSKTLILRGVGITFELKLSANF